MWQLYKKAIVLSCLILASCATDLPPGIVAVKPFQIQPYLGVWHEVARLDHRFERGLTQVTATYSLNADGSVRVLNRGWHASSQQWQEAIGRAIFVGDQNEGRLKVSFFGPFYGGYNVIAYDPSLYTMICGPDRSYLWILSRSPNLDPAILKTLVQRAKTLGFATDQLIYANTVNR